MRRTSFWLLLLGLIFTGATGAAAQKVGKTNDAPSTYHPHAERFDYWRQKAGESPDLEAYVKRLERRYPVERLMRMSGGHGVLSKGGAVSLDDMVMKSDQVEGRTNSMHSILTDQDGDLLMVWKDWGISGPDFFGEPIEPPRLLFTRSTDGGSTWSTPVIVRDDGDFVLDFNWPVMKQSGTGRLVIHDSNPFEPSTMAYSDDGGATWTPGARNEQPFDGLHGPIDGKLWQTYADFNSEMLVYRTSDDGETWSSPEPMFPLTVNGTDFLVYTVIQVDGPTLVMLGRSATHEPCCTDVFAIRKSTDGGETWGSAIALPTPSDGSIPYDGEIAVGPDGDLWIAMVTDNFPESISAEIYYLTSSDVGETWSEPEPFTRYAGPDYSADIAMVNDGPIIVYTSDRYYPDGRIWYGIAGATPDVNPPPFVDRVFDRSYPEWLPPNTPADIAFVMKDERSLAVANLVIEVGSDSQVVPLLDDGNDPDEIPGDGIYSGTLPGLPFGEVATYYGLAEDDSGQEATGNPFSLDRIPVMDAGNAIVAVNRTGSFGNGFNYGFPASGAGQWPGEDGLNYVFASGLWVGVSGGSTAQVMHEYWDNQGTPDWVPVDGSYPVEDNVVSDSDYNFSFTDVGAPRPIGLRVDASLYQWAEGAAANGMVFRYNIRNRSSDVIEELVASIWMDADIHVMGASWDDKVGYDTEHGILYMYDSGDECAAIPELACTDGHVGVMLLEAGTIGKGAGLEPLTAGRFLEANDPMRNGFSDRSFYNLMTKGIDPGLSQGFTPPSDDHRIIMSAPALSLEAGAQQAVAFALVFGNSPEELATNAEAIEAAYVAAPVATEDVATPSEQPVSFGLGQNYPNPFNPSTMIPFSIDESGQVRITVSDVLGRTVATVAEGRFSAGSHQVSFSPADLPSGSYFYTLEVGGKVQTKTLFLLK